jgi:hypothetical protein
MFLTYCGGGRLGDSSVPKKSAAERGGRRGGAREGGGIFVLNGISLDPSGRQ